MEKIETNGTKAHTWIVNAVFRREIDPTAPDVKAIPDDILWDMHCTVDDNGNVEPDQNITDIALFLYIHARLTEENYPQKLSVNPDKATRAIEQFSMLVGLEQLRRMGLVEYTADSNDWIRGNVIINIKSVLSMEELIRNQPIN